MNKKILIYSAIVLFLDQLSKGFISAFMKVGDNIKVISNFFYIRYLNNYGAAWSIFSGNVLFLILVSIFALVLIYVYFLKSKDIDKFEFINYSILIGGIIGNLLDRVKFGKVIDYLDFKVFGYNFPVFNFADMCIVISIILLLIYSLKGGIKYAKNNS